MHIIMINNKKKTIKTKATTIMIMIFNDEE